MRSGNIVKNGESKLRIAEGDARVEALSFTQFGSAQKIQNYWFDIVACLNEVLDEVMEVTTKWCLNAWFATDLNRMGRTWVTLSVMVAKRNIARMWGSRQPLQAGDWKKMVWTIV